MPTAIPPEVREVLRTFLDAGLRRDEPAMRACLSAKTLAAGQFDGSSPQNVRYVFGDAVMEGEAVIVPVRAYPLEGPAAGDPAETPAMEMPCVMVREQGQWKLDLIATTERMFSGGIEAMMGETAKAVGVVMEGISEQLGDVMHEAFGGAGAIAEADKEAERDSREEESARAPADEAEREERQADAGEELDDAAKAKALDDKKFRSAAASFKENEPTWSKQLETIFKRPVPVSLNFDSLQGNYPLVQPFIHQGLAGTLEALRKVALDPACKKFAGRIQGVRISGSMGSSVSVELSDGVLGVRVPLEEADIHPPTAKVFEAIYDLATAFP